MILHISHGAMRSNNPTDVDWFVVHPLEGEDKQVPGGTLTHEMELESLLRAGRVVFEVDLVNKTVIQKVR